MVLFCAWFPYPSSHTPFPQRQISSGRLSVTDPLIGTWMWTEQMLTDPLTEKRIAKLHTKIRGTPPLLHLRWMSIGATLWLQFIWRSSSRKKCSWEAWSWLIEHFNGNPKRDCCLQFDKKKRYLQILVSAFAGCMLLYWIYCFYLTSRISISITYKFECLCYPIMLWSSIIDQLAQIDFEGMQQCIRWFTRPQEVRTTKQQSIGVGH